MWRPTYVAFGRQQCMRRVLGASSFTKHNHFVTLPFIHRGRVIGWKHTGRLFSASTLPPPKKDEEDLVEPQYRVPFQATSTKVVSQAIVGNALITAFKGMAWMKTGSSAMLSETIHSLVDTGNQGLLWLGLREAAGTPDKKHRYGYGRAAYFWSLISALGMFWLGAGVTVSQGVHALMHPPSELAISWDTWAVLAASFGIDGYVLYRVVKEMQAIKPAGVSFAKHLKTIKDPFMMAVFYEDSCACAGVLMAVGGIGMTHLTSNPMWDALASIGIGGLLGAVAVSLIQLNKRFLLGQSVEPEIEQGIKRLLLNRPAIDNVYSVQSQWVGPSTFSYKAEVDFDGTFLAARLLESYKPVILNSKDLEQDLPIILAWYAEDVTRLVESEVKEVEVDIRTLYPQAAFIELEPDSKDTEVRAIRDIETKSLRQVEREAMQRALAELASALNRTKTKDGGDDITKPLL